MSSQSSTKEQAISLAMVCDLQGKLMTVLRDDSRALGSAALGRPFSSFMDSGCWQKAEAFMSRTIQYGAAFDWELNVCRDSTIQRFHFAGAKAGESVLVVASASRSELSQAFERMASERGIVTEHGAPFANSYNDRDDAVHGELSRLNNELVNAQRDLAKKHAELKETEVALRGARDELERRVEDRTAELAETLARVETEVKVRAEAEARMRELSARLLRLQDEERRRIARDLHDTTGQTLSALKLSLASLHNVVGNVPTTQALFEDIDALADQALKEIRTTSHLLHPPLLDEAGFASAARWYSEEFSKRSQIEVTLDIGAYERLPEAVEMVLFRVLQESLTNVLRHSRATKVSVRVLPGENVTLSIQDNGKGIPTERLDQFRVTGGGMGVGLSGMRERARELGAQLNIYSDEAGTTVRVSIPLAAVSKQVREQLSPNSEQTNLVA